MESPGFKRGSTPVHVWDTDIDLTGANVYINYKQNGVMLVEKSGNDVTITPTTVSVRLTQEETLGFNVGELEVQIRYVFPDGTADACDVIRIQAERIIKEGVIR